MRNLMMTLILGLILLLICGCSEIKRTVNIPMQANGDWRIFSFEELVNEKSDLILIATVEDASIRKEQDRQVQEAVLKPEQLLHGAPASEEMILYQSVDHVELGQSYLLFLEYKPTANRYVVVDGNSQLHIPDSSEFLSNIQTITLTHSDVKGDYSLEQLVQLIKRTKLKN